MNVLPLLRRPLAAIGLATATLALAVPAHAEVVFQDIVSPEGIEAWLVEDYAVPIVTIRFAFEGGTSQDPQGKEGLTNLMTTLFDEGAGELDSETFQIALDDAGAEMGFGADADIVYGSMRMLADQRDEAIALLKLAIEAPRFDADPIERMRAQILTGIAASANDPGTLAQRLWAEALYDDHPYARRARGTPETLATITADDLRDHYEQLFARDKLHVGIVGAIDAEEASAMLDTLFGDLPAEPELKPIADVSPELDQQLRVDYDLPQTSILMAYPGIARDDPDYLTAALLVHILGGDSFGSRLLTELREKRGLTYGVSAALNTLEHSQALVISTATAAGQAPEALDVIEQVITDITTSGPTEAELAAAKTYLIGAYPINELNSSSAIADTLVGLQLRDLGIDYIARRAELINAVTIEDIKAMADRLLTAEPAVLQMGPEPAPAAAAE